MGAAGCTTATSFNIVGPALHACTRTGPHKKCALHACTHAELMRYTCLAGGHWSGVRIFGRVTHQTHPQRRMNLSPNRPECAHNSRTSICNMLQFVEWAHTEHLNMRSMLWHSGHIMAGIVSGNKLFIYCVYIHIALGNLSLWHFGTEHRAPNDWLFGGNAKPTHSSRRRRRECECSNKCVMPV